MSAEKNIKAPAEAENTPDAIIKILQEENAAIRGELSGMKEMLAQLMKGNATGKPAKPTIPVDTFKVDDVDYKFTRASATIPGVGYRTALEMLQDNETYAKLGGLTIKEHLVNNASILVEAV